jgi:hypothetical protein
MSLGEKNTESVISHGCCDQAQAQAQVKSGPFAEGWNV